MYIKYIYIHKVLDPLTKWKKTIIPNHTLYIFETPLRYVSYIHLLTFWSPKRKIPTWIATEKRPELKTKRQRLEPKEVGNNIATSSLVTYPPWNEQPAISPLKIGLPQKGNGKEKVFQASIFQVLLLLVSGSVALIFWRYLRNCQNTNLCKGSWVPWYHSFP